MCPRVRQNGEIISVNVRARDRGQFSLRSWRIIVADKAINAEDNDETNLSQLRILLSKKNIVISIFLIFYYDDHKKSVYAIIRVKLKNSV